ncbi:MAG: alkaline phosphatase family protein [Crocinitomicaceae bacterium]|nr:alkaline phosphatase family protein [Crocinitomicaceae bacterium]
MKIALSPIISLLLFLSFSLQSVSQITKPKLVVGIVVDQMCYEYLYRYQSKFSNKGFVKLMNNGTHCRNTQYNYVPTYTGPGHASIYTGTTPNNHGIVANDWYHRGLKKTVNCVGDESVSSVGSADAGGKKSPKNLKTNTITDQLKLTYPNSKVISVSIKDRSAILPGGHLSDGTYWFDFSSGGFLTSSFFKTELPEWAKNFNAKKTPDSYLKETWNTYFDINSYTESGPDDSPYEHLLKGKKTPTFPYDLKVMTEGKMDYELFTYTPFANTYLADFALEALQKEKLGQGKETDFLAISFSSTDILGHSFGPNSIEIEDMYIRLDLEIAKIIAELEKKVGKENFVLFLTADHAVVPVPQKLIDQQLPGGYLNWKPLVVQLRKEVVAKYGVDFIASRQNSNFYFDRELLATEKIKLEDAQDFVKSKVKNWENVKSVYTASELENSAADFEWKDMIRRGYRFHESGDVIYILEPGFISQWGEAPAAYKGTTHGSSFNYDTHVPLIWYGANIPTQEILRRINITDITATLVPILQLQKPSATTGEPILELFK